MNVIDQFRGPVQQKLEKHPILAWREEIPTRRVEELRRAQMPESRKRLWTVEFMLWFWLTAGIHRERSFNAVGTELWTAIVAEVPELAGRKLNSGRMTEGRARIPIEMLREVREEFAAKGVEEGQGMGLWRGRRVMWLDGSTLSMPDEPELRKAFGGPRNQRGTSPFPVMRIVNLGIAATRMVVGSAYGSYKTSEIELSDPLLEKIQAGDVLTADRYFASAQNMARVKRQGADAVMRKHAGLKVSLHKRRRIGPEDWILELSVPVEARKAHPELPEMIEIRVFHVVVGHGAQRVELWIETTLLDAQRYSKEELARVYLERWGVETSYAELKVELHLDILRSQTVAGVYREVEAHLAAYNYIRLQMLRAAKHAGVDARRLSFIEAVRTILKVGQMMEGCENAERRGELLGIMLEQIAAATIRQRPGRHEPRAVKRPPKPFPRFKGSREEWRKGNDFAA
jgi:hypothetical protein